MLSPLSMTGEDNKEQKRTVTILCDAANLR